MYNFTLFIYIYFEVSEVATRNIYFKDFHKYNRSTKKKIFLNEIFNYSPFKNYFQMRSL